MQLDRLALHLRRRRAWEAIDLGCSMGREWWRPVVKAWCVAYLPAALVIYAVLHETPWAAVLTLWWLKPLFDRVVLEVLSRAAFGEVARVADVLRAVARSPGLLAGLTIDRFDLARSFNLAVWHLERLRGAPARSRIRVLQRHTRRYAVWLTMAFFHFEVVMMLAFYGAIDVFTPAHHDAALGVSSLFAVDGAAWRQWASAAFQFAAWTLLEPFYVAAGFALYLNRRTQLEAWDVELAFRRIAARPAIARAAAVGALVFGAVLLACVGAQPAVAAARDAQSPEAAIEQVLAAPEFESYRPTTRLRYIGGDRAKERTATMPDSGNPVRLGGLAEILRALMWLAVAAAVLAVVYYGRLYVARRLPEREARVPPPHVLFGMEIAPQSLPHDLAGAATAAADAGRAREALGLLYRGALSALVNRDGVDLGAGDTEGDCVRRTAARVNADKAAYFGALVAAWQAAAYGGRAPEPEGLRALCREWATHFDGSDAA